MGQGLAACVLLSGTLACVASIASGGETYDFNHLGVGQSLVGQDGWMDSGGISNPTVRQWADSPAAAGGVESWASRRFDGVFPGRLTLGSPGFVATFDTLFLPSAPSGGAQLTLFRDLDSDSRLDPTDEPWVTVGLDRDGVTPRIRLLSSGILENEISLIGDLVEAEDRLRIRLESLSDGGQVSFAIVIENETRNPGVNVTVIPSTPTSFSGEAIESLDTMAIRQGGGFIDNIGIEQNLAPCLADLASPFGVLDLFDVNAFVTGFFLGEPIADLVEPFGLLDLNDVSAFVSSFLSGCP